MGYHNDKEGEYPIRKLGMKQYAQKAEELERKFHKLRNEQGMDARSPQPKDSRPNIIQLLDDLTDHIEHTHEAFDRLAVKIGPVRNPVPTSDSESLNKSDADPAIISPVADRIMHSMYRIRQLRRQINQLESEIDLP